MPIAKRHPPVKITVGAQYICFDKPDTNGEFTTEYETDVLKIPNVTTLDVSDKGANDVDYASGFPYDTDNDVKSIEIKQTQIARDPMLLAKMKGYSVNGGIVIGKSVTTRPFFAYGIPIIRKGGVYTFRWYPKCKLTDSTDKTETSEQNHKSMTDDDTILAMPFNDAGDLFVEVNTDSEDTAGITEDKFFTKPILTAADAQALKA